MIIKTEPNAYDRQRAVEFGIRMVEEETQSREIARLESAQKWLMKCYAGAHPSAKSEPIHMYIPQTSHKSIPQLYARITDRINELRRAI